VAVSEEFRESAQTSTMDVSGVSVQINYCPPDAKEIVIGHQEGKVENSWERSFLSVQERFSEEVKAVALSAIRRHDEGGFREAVLIRGGKEKVVIEGTHEKPALANGLRHQKQIKITTYAFRSNGYKDGCCSIQ
jgi:hypothetical protein